MNHIHEKVWAEDSWSGHTGMDSASDYATVKNEKKEVREEPHSESPSQNVTTHSGKRPGLI